MMARKVELNITEKGLMLTAVIFVVFDMIATWMVARADLELFLLNELNLAFKWAFLQLGWWAFLVYPFVPMLLYAGFISGTFSLWDYFQRTSPRARFFKPSFYFPLVLLSFHFWVIVNNIILYIRIENLKYYGGL
jgi:hypothetical protein